MSREEDLIAIVSENKKIEVNELAERLNVSKVTIRKDLDKLEKRGIVSRQHGYAVIGNQDDINYRLAKKYDIKRKIAKKATSSIQDGETIFIESGSTCVLLAEEIAKTKKDVTIVTNSCFLANYIRKEKQVKIVLLGGEYQKNSQVNVGPLVKQGVANFFVDKLFVGVDGFDSEHGFSGSDMMRCDTTREMANYAKHTIVLTDSSKFSKRGLIAQFSLKEVAKVYTDKAISDEVVEILLENEIQVFTV